MKLQSVQVKGPEQAKHKGRYCGVKSLVTLTGEGLQCVATARECDRTTGVLLGNHKEGANTITTKTLSASSACFHSRLTFGLLQVLQIWHILANQKQPMGDE